jgi:very-short-patch-repair endonuclease
MKFEEVFDTHHGLILRSADLIAFGATSHVLTSAVRDGRLIRPRRDHHVLPTIDRHILQSVRVGGRLGCVSALSNLGIFTFDNARTHIHMLESMSRTRSPGSRVVPLTKYNRDGCILHWWPLSDEEGASSHTVGAIDALAQSLRCQDFRYAVASLDNALFLGRIDEADLGRIFAGVPQRYHPLKEQIDGRAEAGQESVLRMIVRETGAHCELQVSIGGVGRVDLLVEGCLVLEADSRLAHEGWERHVADRGRDLVLAAQGYMSLRPAYQHTMNSPQLVREAVLNLLAAANRFRTHIS